MNTKARLMRVTLLAGSMVMLPVSATTASATPTAPASPGPVLQWDEIAANTVVESASKLRWLGTLSTNRRLTSLKSAAR